MDIKNEYDSLVRTYCSDPLDREFLEVRNARLEETLKRCLAFAGRELSSDMLIGWLPLKQANACARQSRHGHMILINDGLEPLALAVASLFAAVVPADSGGRIVPPVLDIAEAAKVFSMASEVFVEGVPQRDRPPSLVQALERLKGLAGPRERFALWHYDALIDFVIAHELAHVLNGDFGDPEAFDSHFYLRDLDVKSCQVELKADHVAGRLLQSMYAGSFQSRADHENTPEDRGLTGAVLFFDALEATWWTQGVSHPSPAERRAALICDTFPEESSFTPVPNLDSAVRTVAMLRGIDPETLEAPIRYASQEEWAAALEPLRNYASSLAPDQVSEISAGSGAARAYSTVSVRDMMMQSHEIARSLVALVALGYIKSGPATNFLPRIDLGIFTSVYTEVHGQHPDSAPFLSLLRQSIGNIDEIVDSVAAYRKRDATIQYYTRETDTAKLIQDEDGRGASLMNTVIVFGPVPGDCRKSLIKRLEASDVDLNIFVGTTINNVIASGVGLRLSPNLSPCIVHFEHDVPGIQNRKLQDADFGKWAQTFLVRIHAELAEVGWSEDNEPESRFHFSKDGGGLAIFTWTTIATRDCIQFCRAVELAFEDISR